MGTHCECLVNGLCVSIMSCVLIVDVLSIIYLSPLCHGYSLCLVNGLCVSIMSCVLIVDVLSIVYLSPLCHRYSL